MRESGKKALEAVEGYMADLYNRAYEVVARHLGQ